MTGNPTTPHASRMTEPTGQTIDGTPWEEPRPPHLPDRLASMPWLAWPFLIFAAVLAGVAWPRAQDVLAAGGPYGAWSVVTQLDPILTVLLGAALFWRHPDAARELPRIAVCVALLATGEILRLIAEPLAPILAGITPPTEALPGFVPLGSAFDAFATSIGLFGLVYLVRGLDEARRFEDEGSLRRIAIPLVALGLAIGIGKFVRLGQLPVDDTLTVGTVVAVSLILSTLDLLAWVYLIVICARGWRSGDAPSRGWLAALLAGVCVMVAAVLTSAIELLVSTPSEATFLVYLAFASIGTVGWILLLIAFGLGLPSTADPDATADPPVATTPGFAGS